MVSRSVVVVARLYLGVIFLVAAVGKLASGIDFAGPLGGFLSNAALPHGYGWYARMLNAVVVPHVHLFAALVIAGEAVAAVLLLFGLATRLGAALAIFLLLNYLCAKGAVPWSPGSNDTADIVLAAIVFAGAGGRTLGLDRYLHERFPRSALF